MVITTPTKDEVRDATKDKIDELFLYVAVGDGDTIPDASDTALDNETFRTARFDVDKTTIADEITVTGEVGFGDNNGEIIEEIGWFDESSGGRLLSRDVLINPITKTSDIEVVLPKRVIVTVVEV
jgi:hypothetical protein